MTSNVVSHTVINNLLRRETPSLETYFNALRNSCNETPPPFGQKWYGDNFRKYSMDASWFSELLAKNAYMEGYSAKQIYIYAHSGNDSHISNCLKRHAIDEASHSHVFVKILCSLFPESITKEKLVLLKGYVPELTQLNLPNGNTGHKEVTYEAVLSTLIQINLFEIQALFLQYLLKPCVMAYCPEDKRKAISTLCDRLISDEINHIEYTACLIERAAKSGYEDYIFSSMRSFQNTLSDLTLAELTASEMIGGID